jgi:hypothetical protein
VCIYLSIVFKLGPVQGPGSRFWPGHRVVWVNLKKSKKDIVLVKQKNKSQRVATEFLAGSYPVNQVVGSTCQVSWVTLGFAFSYFFKPDPILAQGWPVGLGRVSKLYNWVCIYLYIKKKNELKISHTRQLEIWKL